MTPSYLTNAAADDYFAMKHAATLWHAANPATKTSVLLQATQIIDRLNYVGLKHTAYIAKQAGGSREEVRAAANTQSNQFPRNADTQVPQEILDACCEIAYALLSGIDPDKELRLLATASETMGPLGVRVTYDRNRMPDWTLAGVPSPTAWQMLVPFLRDMASFTVSRG